MMGENSKVELVDKLREEFEQAIKTYREHLHADRIDLLKEDDKVWKEKEKAWREQLEKVYPSYHKATEITENSDQLQDKLETMAVEFTCEPEVPFFLRGQSQIMRNQKREEWERMALPRRCAMMQTPLTEEEKWIR